MAAEHRLWHVELIRAFIPHACLKAWQSGLGPASLKSSGLPTHQATVTTMTKELRTLQVQFEEAISTHQREADTLREKLREIAAERSSVRREVRRGL